MPAERDRLVEEIRKLRDAMMHAGSLGGHGGPWMELDLTVGQLRVLFSLAGQQPTTMSGVAQRLGVTLPAASTAVDKLVQASLVTRQENPSDRRFVQCGLTEQGQALIQRLSQAGPMQHDELFERMTLAELRTVAKALAIFNRVLAEQHAARLPDSGGPDTS